MKVRFTNTYGIVITVETTNTFHIPPIVECDNKEIKECLEYNFASHLASYGFTNEVAGAKELYGEIFTLSAKSDKLWSVQTNTDLYMKKFFMKDMAIMGYVAEVLE